MSTAEPPDSRSDDPATARAAFTSAARSAVRLWSFALAAGLLWGLGGALLMRALAMNAGYSQAEAWVLACAIGIFGRPNKPKEYRLPPTLKERLLFDMTSQQIQNEVVLVVYRDKVLLHRHKKRGGLLPVGGHVDRDELPQETALREAIEEAGLEITLHNADTIHYPDVQALVRPAHMLLVNMNPYHQHIDFIFYATATTDQVQPVDGESAQLFWFTKDEVLAAVMPENVRILAIEALELLGQA